MRQGKRNDYAIEAERISPKEAADFDREDVGARYRKKIRGKDMEIGDIRNSGSRSPLGTLGRLIIIILGILYILSPIDLIPDIIFFIGWLDDLGVLAIILPTLIGLIRNKSSQKS